MFKFPDPSLIVLPGSPTIDVQGSGLPPSINVYGSVGSDTLDLLEENKLNLALPNSDKLIQLDKANRFDEKSLPPVQQLPNMPPVFDEKNLPKHLDLYRKD